jgi:hypothetical protein
VGEGVCSACNKKTETLFMRYGQVLCYACFDEANTGIPYVRDLEAELTRLRALPLLDAALAERIAEKVERACLDYDTDDMSIQQMIELYVKIILRVADEAGKAIKIGDPDVSHLPKEWNVTTTKWADEAGKEKKA